jgi:hypothetical protein
MSTAATAPAQDFPRRENYKTRREYIEAICADHNKRNADLRAQREAGSAAKPA